MDARHLPRLMLLGLILVAGCDRAAPSADAATPPAAAAAPAPEGYVAGEEA